MVTEVVFTTEGLPPGDRPAYWQDWLSRTHAPVLLSTEHTDGFTAHQRVVRFGGLSAWPASYHPLVLRRTPKLIRQSDPEVYHLSWLRHGVAGVSWNRHEATLGAGELHTNHSSRPFTIWAGRDEFVHSTGLHVPKDLLPLPPRTAVRALGRPMSSRSGFGALLADALTRITTDTASFGPDDGPRLASVVVDLVAAMFAHALDADRALPPETRHRALTLRAHAFIRQHLHEPDLTPAAVAAGLHISTGYLHRLFQAEGVTVSAWIRDQRLRRAKQDLADPSIPVQDVAARWGFSRHTVFTRAFRAAFGLSPSEYRERLATPG